MSNQPSNLKTAVYAEINSDVYDRLCLRIIWLTLSINGELADLASVGKSSALLVNSALAFLQVTVILPSLLLLLAS
ncbi:MAG: hypothetical protein V7K55_23460 [Nostoc sp.]|uniref:hypothetical protein n=1 Tax=Nostoc sp. TaxID=1180 RepID=UPI002FF5231B